MVGMFGAGAGGWVTPSKAPAAAKGSGATAVSASRGLCAPIQPLVPVGGGGSSDQSLQLQCRWAHLASSAVTEAGGQAAGDKAAQRQEARKEEEGRQSAVAEVPAAVAAPAGAAACPQRREGSKVRPPDRKPRESGDTPGGKVTRSDEPARPASPTHWRRKGHVGPEEGRPAGWSIAGKSKHNRGVKPTIC